MLWLLFQIIKERVVNLILLIYGELFKYENKIDEMQIKSLKYTLIVLLYDYIE